MHLAPADELDDTALKGALALQQRLERAMDPDIEPIGVDEFRACLTDDHTDGNRHVRMAVLEGSEVLALAHLEFETDPANLHFASTEIVGAAENPDAGRVAVASIVDMVAADGRDTLMGWGPDTAAEGAFWTSVGATFAYSERFSDLDLTAVDADLMASWIAAREERAGDVTLVRWVDRCPDEYLDAYATSSAAMSDAPTGALSVNDWSVEPDRIRVDEAARAAVGIRIHVILGLTPDGAPVGHTSIHENTHRPSASWQWDTVVIGAHRRRGIGRWLKAEMWQYLRREAPHITRLRTGNANNNDAMLAINVAMGFTPVHQFGAWQGAVDDYRAALG